MNLPILTLEVRQEHDVVAARQYSRQITAALGFDSNEQTRFATAVSEITRNAFRYAGGGLVSFEITGSGPQSFSTVIRDSGKGINDPEVVLSGRYHSTSGMGMGIVGAQRLVDDFQLETGPTGTTVTLRKVLGRPVTRSDVAALSMDLRQRRQGGPLDELERQNAELMQALAELQRRQSEIERLNYELAETNRGVLALNAELEDKADSLRKASEAKSRFLSHMSHELRTPLNSIRSLTRILASRSDGPLSSEQERQVEFIRTSADSLLELVDDLLDLAKIEAGKVDVQVVPFTLANLFSALRGMFRPLFTSSHVTLEFSDPTGFPPVLSDESKLSQILRNFISNAMKYTEAGSVTVQAVAEGRTLRISVHDSGIGIPHEHLPLIFEEFVQIKNPLQKKARGSGIGLPLSQRLAQLLGGRIEVESAPGVGSVFTVVLPSALQASVAQDGRAGRRILIVDDAEVDRYTLRALLPADWEVEETSEAMRAVELAASVRPSVIFLDLGMPDADGTEVLQRLKRDPRTATMKVIVYTSRMLSERDTVELRALGAHAVLEKGFSDLEFARAEIVRALGAGAPGESLTR